MKWFNSKMKREIIDLKEDVEALKRELKRRTEMRIGDLPNYYPFCGYQNDPRPSIKIIDYLNLIVDRMGLEAKQTPSIPSKIVIENKKKSRK